MKKLVLIIIIILALFPLIKGYTDDIVNLYSKYVIDAAMLSKVDVYLNDELIPVNNIQTYSRLYKTPTEEHLLIKTKDSEVLVTPCEEFQAVSFFSSPKL